MGERHAVDRFGAHVAEPERVARALEVVPQLAGAGGAR